MSGMEWCQECWQLYRVESQIRFSGQKMHQRSCHLVEAIRIYIFSYIIIERSTVTTKAVYLSNVYDWYVILFIFVPRIIFEIIKWSVLLEINFHLVFAFQYSTLKALSTQNCSNNWSFGGTFTHNTERGTIKFDFVETSPPN